ncbi:hypothetical protein DRF65_16975 [Chryseobacterium pennae]|uniref:Uncharacterized protein n=1 Tax=Chryseobacterium pennae TaxID=2258962 RepID=A0A3D9C6H7_9FLAO|nr:hypothetical protein DRF65_16975 [Chryseobacterium pennae]
MFFQLEVDDETLTYGIGLLLSGNLVKDAVSFGIEVSLSNDTGNINTAKLPSKYAFFLRSLFF